MSSQYDTQGWEEAFLADAVRAAVIDERTRRHTMQPRDAIRIARHLLAVGYVRQPKVEPKGEQ